MKKIFLIMVIVAFHASLLSQDAEEKKTDNIKGKNAILFNFDGFNLNSFNGGFGWKKWISNSIAVNSKFKILLSKEEKERTDELSGSESRQKSFELTFGIEKHLQKNNKLSPYIGGQLGVSYEEINNKIIPNKALYYSRFDDSYKNESERKLLSMTIQIIFGIEYYLKENISLSGQYSFGSCFGVGEEKTVTNIVDGIQDISKTRFGIGSSSLILSIYL